MPGFSKTGPCGQGSQTGRKLGRCDSDKTSTSDEIHGCRNRGAARGFRNRFNEISQAEFRNFSGRRRGMLRRNVEDTINNKKDIND